MGKYKLSCSYFWLWMDSKYKKRKLSELRQTEVNVATRDIFTLLWVCDCVFHFILACRGVVLVNHSEAILVIVFASSCETEDKYTHLFALDSSFPRLLISFGFFFLTQKKNYRLIRDQLEGIRFLNNNINLIYVIKLFSK